MNIALRELALKDVREQLIVICCRCAMFHLKRLTVSCRSPARSAPATINFSTTHDWSQMKRWTERWRRKAKCLWKHSTFNFILTCVQSWICWWRCSEQQERQSWRHGEDPCQGWPSEERCLSQRRLFHGQCCYLSTTCKSIWNLIMSQKISDNLF